MIADVSKDYELKRKINDTSIEYIKHKSKPKMDNL
jgi:hypothetical protein